jgi:hypothetical protein
MYFRIYKQLLDKKMLKQYASKDILLFLEHIKKIKINGHRQKSQKIIALLYT